MPFKINRSALISFSAQQMFDVVNDIEAYPQFMEGCKEAKILRRDADVIEAKLTLSKAGITQSFITRNQLNPPHSMSMTLVEGPFKRLKGGWQFQRLNDNACKVIFELEFDLQNPLLGFAAGKLMESVANQQVDGICQRARVVYPHPLPEGEGT